MGLTGIAGSSIPARSDDGDVPPGSNSIAGSKVDEGNVPRWPTGPPVTDWPPGPVGSETDGGHVPHRPTGPTGIAGSSTPARSDDGNVPPGSTSISSMKVDEDSVP